MITEIKSDEPISIDGILTTVEVEQQKSYNQALEDMTNLFIDKWSGSDEELTCDTFVKILVKKHNELKR